MSKSETFFIFVEETFLLVGGGGDFQKIGSPFIVYLQCDYIYSLERFKPKIASVRTK